MAIALPTTFSTRERYRADILAALEGLVTDATHTVQGGDYDGAPVVTRKDLDEAIATVFRGPMPDLDEHAAEVSTPGYVEVRAKCPSCGITAKIPVSLNPQLVVETTGAHLKVKATAKEKVHACGQTTIDEATEPANGQTTLDGLDVTEEGEADPPPAETTGPTEFDDEPGEQVVCVGSNHVPGCEHFPALVVAGEATPVCNAKYGPRMRLRCALAPDHQGGHGQPPEADGDDLLPD